MQVDDQQRQLLNLNGLSYRLAPSLSVATQRSHRKFPATRAVFVPGNTMQLVAGSGSAYVSPKESWIEFDLAVAVTTEEAQIGLPGALIGFGGQVRSLTFGESDVGHSYDLYGASTSMMDQYRWVHSSGTELERTDNLNKWSRMRRQYELSTGYHTTAESVAKLSSIADEWDGVPNETAGLPPFAAAQTKVLLYKRVQIPLWMISDVFDTDMLLPSFLVAGSQIESKLASAGDALTLLTVSGALANASDYSLNYEVRNAHLVLSTVTLTDSIQRALSNISVTGLEIPFNAVFTQSQNAADSRVSVQISRALSRANKIVGCLYMPNRNTTNFDSHSTAPYPRQSRWQVQLGAEHLPIQPVDSIREAYTQALIAFGKLMDRDSPPGVTYDQFVDTSRIYSADHATAMGNAGVYAITLEKSSTLSQSGSAISAQRVCNMNLDFGDGGEAGRVLLVFVEYVKLITVFLDSAVVRS